MPGAVIGASYGLRERLAVIGEIVLDALDGVQASLGRLLAD